MNITKLSIERPTLIMVIYSVIFIVGLISYYLLSYELVPKFTPPTIAVTAIYSGSSPREVEDKVTRPIEDVLSSISNINRINSSSQENFSLVRLELSNGTDVDLNLQEVQRRLATIANDLPVGVIPVVSKFDFDDLPVLRLGMKSQLNDAQLFDFATDVIQPALSQIEGVAQVRILGGKEREVKVEIDPRKLSAFGLSILQVTRAIRNNNIDVPAGSLGTERSRLLVRVSGTFKSLDELRNLQVGKNRGGGKISLSEIASVRDDFREAKVLTRINGEKSVGIEIRKQSDANAVGMSADVRAKLKQLEQLHIDQSLLFTIAADSSEFTLKAANAVTVDLMLAILLVSMVMLLFLHSLRNAVIVLVSIPTSIFATLIVMYFMGYSLNLMTLLGLSLAIGILVDDSIVVLENIYRHLEMGKNRMKSAYEGRMEIGFTALSITLVDVVVFMPILFATGIVADLFAQFSIVMITSTLMSLFVSFTLVPLVASRFSKHKPNNGDGINHKVIRQFEELINKLITGMTTSLNWALRHSVGTITIAILLFVGSVSLLFIGSIGAEFTKAGDRGEFILEIELPNDATLESTNRVAIQVENYLLKIPEVETVFTTVGLTSSGRIETNPTNVSEFLIKLSDKQDRTIAASELARRIKLDLQGNIPDIIVSPIEINLIGLREDGAIEVTVFGPDLVTIQSVADDVKVVLDKVPGTVEVKSSVKEGGVNLELIIDHEKRELLGLELSQIAATIRTALNGTIASQYYGGERNYDINVRLSDNHKRQPGDLDELSVLNNKGQPVSIDQISDLQEVSSPSRFERTNRSPSITIKSQVIGRTGGAVGREFQEKMAGLPLPQNVNYVFTGQLQRLSEGFQTLGIALIASILFVYLILVALYNSYVYPFVVLFSIPMAIVGALLLLALTQESLNIFSIMGLIMLVGLVGKNAILVVDFTNKLRAQGKSIYEALIEATQLRFRPVLMTNLSMVIGLLPIALAGDAGSEWKNGLAIALIGGLSSSMFLSLILVPVVYAALAKVRK